LNPVQCEAAEATEGPVLVLAGAGSGKTRILTYRIVYLLLEKHVPPSQILAMTFTNKAAGEMKERVGRFIGRDKTMAVGTFHSIFSRLLRWEADRMGFTRDFVIYDADDQERLVKIVMEEKGLAVRDISPRSVASAISRAKNAMIDPTETLSLASTPIEQVVANVYTEYQRRLRSYQAFDFDDLLCVPVRLFHEHADVLEKYRSRFRYIMVDEYQDTNRAQYRLITRLAEIHRNLCVVGDDDQSIYGWRGADIRNILDFGNDFPDARVFRLEQNYRSTQNILKAAVSVVEKNTKRMGKTLWTSGEEGEKVDIFETESETDEAQRIVECIKKEVFRKKRTFRDFAVLYRTNAQSRVLEDALRRSGMSYVIVGGVRFYERKEIKDILAYLKVIVNPKDTLGLVRIVNFPLRGIGDVTIQKVAAWAEANGETLFGALGRINEVPEIPQRIRTAVAGFHQLIQKYIDLAGKIDSTELVHTLVDETGLLGMYKGDTSPEAQGRVENIREFLAAIREYSAEENDPTLSGFLERVTLITDIDRWDDGANAITLMTLHSAKGLEFPVVFISGLEEGLFPVYRSMDQAESIEEERRLFHVGLTRAKEKVNLLWAGTRNRFNDLGSGRLPSRFLDEIDPSVVVKHEPRLHEMEHGFRGRKTGVDFHEKEFGFRRRKTETDFEGNEFGFSEDHFSQENRTLQVGLRVQHELYGNGRIVAVEGLGIKQRVSVHFDGGFEKKFLAQYAKLTLL
jgi:DNA helicase-2/ATP-dependent DNA helicase PcrA